MASFLQYGLPLVFALYAAGAVSSAVLYRKAGMSSFVGHALASLASFAGLLWSLALLFSGETISLHAGSTGIAIGIIHLQVDPLGAFFCAIISIVALCASLYGIGYQKQFIGTYDLGHFGFFYNAFLASMLLVVTASSGLLFLFAWELMAIASYFLVVFDRKAASNVRAGILYVLISQIGAAFLFAAFLLLYRFTGSWEYDVIRASAGSIALLPQNIILALALVGLAFKAGVIPLHVWLPEAHPAAPSHVSALMSGVMIKTAIVMIIRFFIDFFPAPHPWWGLFVLMLGAISAILGILYALSERDIKRLLAFSSIENIGIIFLGLGASIAFFSFGIPGAGIIALIAALYHTVNHALFKALLFLSAGSVVHATGTRNMEEYGGLIKLMPWTAVFFLIGAVAISGLPPFNGFVSEWLTFQTLFSGVVSLTLSAKIVFLAGASSLAFTGGLAAACFVKAFGVTFLARPRSEHAKRAHESEPVMQFGMALLSILIVLFGVAASTVTPILSHIARSLRGFPAENIASLNPGQTIAIGDFSSLSMAVVAAIIVAAIIVAYLLTWITSRGRKLSRVQTWDCGVSLTPRMEITATGFSRSIMMVFHGLLRSTTQTETEYHDATSRYFPVLKRVEFSLPNFYHLYIYQPVVALVDASAGKVRKIQTGNLNTYLLYMFATLITLLLWSLR
ncbi:hydrogenase 4 subunit B [Candidatus Kaiserbacteria bacterium]|nr:hydrogenase 4 subunit B [Candidatus Kaiserbacteria bacterium]